MGVDVFDQNLIDNLMNELDGTENKSVLGANGILSVSMAVAKAAASASNQSLYRYIGGVNANTLPVPMMNIINGGSHADNKIDFQEFMVMPFGAESFSHALRMGTEVFHSLRNVLKAKGYSTNVGDEGGFAPEIQSNEEAIETVLTAIEKAGYRPGEDIWIALDPAASEFYNTEEKVYHLHKSTGAKLSSNEMAQYWTDWANKYPIASIEDGMAEDDWADGKKLSQQIKDELKVKVQKRVDEGKKQPHLAAVLVGLDGASQTYVTSKINSCKEVGFKSTLLNFDTDATEEEVLAAVHQLNDDKDIDGFIVQLPLPKHINADKITYAIDPKKDVDGFHPVNIGNLTLGLDTFISATPFGIMKMLERYEIETS
eukprot:maker-scaffold6793_size3599-snap-gene-0.0 protein:Tk02774 transcript:maker-scaffold6793_size3599-snap-gene-0.0-mRNA-1 annotation:"enolase"